MVERIYPSFLGKEGAFSSSSFSSPQNGTVVANLVVISQSTVTNDVYIFHFLSFYDRTEFVSDLESRSLREKIDKTIM